MSKLFRLWNKQQVEEAVLALEEGLTLGLQSIQYPTGGGSAFTTPEKAMKVLRALYARLDEIEGVRRSTGPRSWTIINRSGL